MWQTQTPAVALGPIKSHINDDLALRKKFRSLIYATHIATIIVAFWMDLQRLINWPWVMTSVTILCFFIQIYKLQKSKNNRYVAAELTPRDALVAALQQNKINLRNAWIFSTIIPLSGLIGGLIGGLLSRFLISVDNIQAADSQPNTLLIFIMIIIIMVGAIVVSHLYGRKVFKAKKAERAILRKRLTLLEAGL